MSKLLTALRNATKKIEAELADSSLFTHAGEIGTIRENIIGKFLRPYLPDCYSIGTGQIFDSADAMSRQIDVVLYDQLFSTALFKGDDVLLLPYESVYGTIEVKSTLSTKELGLAMDNIASVRCLNRAESNISFSLPHYGSTISDKPGNTIQFDKRRANSPLNIIFAYEGLTAESCIAGLADRLASAPGNKELMPDFVFNFKRGYMITKGQQKSDGWWLALREFRGAEDFDGYFHVNTGNDTLAMFYLATNSFLNRIRLNALNPTEYWNQLFSEITAAPATDPVGT